MTKKEEDKELEMFVAGLVLDPNTNAPIVVLKNVGGDICLPIWIGLAEATAIASSLKNVPVARPMTHDLLKSLISELNGKVTRIMITNLEENTFYANIEIACGEVVKIIDARPSDAIALAVREDVPIVVNESVLAEAQVALVPVDAEAAADLDLSAEHEEAEKDSSSNFANIKKEKWEEILADMDPDDFKYKM